MHLIGMKNAGGYSACNPIERPMVSVTFGTQALALDRLEGPREVEHKIKECTNIEGFVAKHKHDEGLISECKKRCNHPSI